jgi:serine/threonine protein phosphatase PrpC
VKELVINPEEKAVASAQKQRHTASVSSFAPSTVTEVARNGQLFVQAEGVTGTTAAAIASRYVSRKIVHGYYSGTAGAATDMERRLVAAVQQANLDLFERNSGHPNRRPVTVSTTAALIHNNKLIAASIGDDRIYVVWDQDIELLTPGEDDNDSAPVRVLSPKPKTPSPSPEQLPASFRERLTAGAGLAADMSIKQYVRRLFAGDVVVVCSGALAGYFKGSEIARAVNLYPPEQAADRLVALAAERGNDHGAITVLRLLTEPLAAKKNRGGHVTSKPNLG